MCLECPTLANSSNFRVHEYTFYNLRSKGKHCPKSDGYFSTLNKEMKEQAAINQNA